MIISWKLLVQRALSLAAIVAAIFAVVLVLITTRTSFRVRVIDRIE
jgi:hypothetical protein